MIFHLLASTTVGHCFFLRCIHVYNKFADGTIVFGLSSSPLSCTIQLVLTRDSHNKDLRYPQKVFAKLTSVLFIDTCAYLQVKGCVSAAPAESPALLSPAGSQLLVYLQPHSHTHPLLCDAAQLKMANTATFPH